MSSIATQLNYTYNLNHGVRLTILPMAFLTGNKEGHTFYISVVDNKGPVELSDVSVSGWLIPNDKGLVDDLSVPLSGKTEFNTAILSLPQEAYFETGRFSLVINLNKNGKTSTIFWAAGNISRSNTDSQVDVGNVIPSLEDLLSQISRIENATNSANAATINANNATQRANDAAANIEGMTVGAHSTSSPNVNISEKDGVKHIEFGLVTPSITFEAETGAAGTEVEIEQSGTPENPVVKLTIPRGDTGNINGLDYYESNPAALGKASPGTTNGVARGNHVHPMPSAEDVHARPDTWMPDANDIGALPKDATAADSSKLGGKTLEELMLAIYPVGSIYMSVAAVSPETLFGGTWERLKDRFLLGAGDHYENDSTGGEAETALEVNHLPPHDHETYTRAVYSGNGSYTSLCKESQSVATDKTGQTGGGEPHNNMPPYLVVNMWKRMS